MNTNARSEKLWNQAAICVKAQHLAANSRNVVEKKGGQ
jgi:hypothetical protein